MSTFDELMGEVMATADRFGHREHVRLTWLAVRRCGTAGAVELTAYHIDQEPEATFEDLVTHNPGLLDKRLLTRFYQSHTLASPAARTGWVEPDVRAFPG